MDGESDQIHALLDINPDNNISQLVASLKSASSRIVRQEFKEAINKVYSQPVFWSGSYYIASSGGVTIERLKKYIDRREFDEVHKESSWGWLKGKGER